MALNAYLKIKGQKQGEIKGSATQKGREGRIQVIAADHEVVAPADPASGMASGKQTHKPFVITKEVDHSSPLLYTALVNNENMAEWELQFFRALPTGVEQQHYTVKLTNARITDINFHMPNNKNPDLAKYLEYEVVAFTYQKIQWIWTDGGVTAEGAWMELRA